MEIELCGYKVQIDEEDYDRVVSHRWGVKNGDLTRCGRVYFRHVYTDEHGIRHDISLQRFILGLTLGDRFHGDHINGDTLDNRKCNLRKCTVAQNCQNSKRHKDNQTGYKGVTYDKRRACFRSSIHVNKTTIYLGVFPTPEEAHAAYCEASKKYHGEFGRTE